MLSQIGGALIDISGQYSQQLLLQTEGHINIVDIFGAHDEIREQYRECYDEFLDTLDELNTLVKKEDELKSKKDLYVFQNDELNKASLVPEEEDGLLKEKNILINAKDLHDKTYGVYVEMYENDVSYISALKSAYKSIEEASAIDEALEEQRKSLESIILELEDNALSLRAYADKINIDPERLEQVESRLDVIYRLKKKYNKTIFELIDYQKMMEADLNKIESFSDDINKLKDKLKINSNKLWAIADKLSEKRKKASAILRKRVEKELKSIGMEKTDFYVEIKSQTRSDTEDPKSYVIGLDISGKDEVEFFHFTKQGRRKKTAFKNRIRWRAFKNRTCN